MPSIIDPLLSLIFLIVIEVVLGMDNLIFLAILTERLPAQERRKVRSLGLSGAWVLRIVLLYSALWLSQLSKPLFMISHFGFAVRELFFIFGGAFLVYKSCKEISSELDLLDHKKPNALVKENRRSLVSLIVQVMLMDLVFSLDSVLTAVGLTKEFLVMGIAITVAIIVMFYASDWVSGFIHKHPSVKMLALSFLVMIGMFLIADGFHYEISRAYLYFSMFFSFLVESLNMFYKHRQNHKKGKKS